MRKKIKYVILIILVVLTFKFLWVFDPFIGDVYDLLTQQENVTEFSINNFPIVTFEDLPESEKEKYENGTCNKFEYEKTEFIKVEWFDRYKYAVGNARIYKFLTPDRLIRNRIRIPNLDKTQYLLINADVINVYQELIIELKKQGFNIKNVKITSGFRNPEYNKMIGGVSCSQHQIGTAIDIFVGDINGDKTADKIDRKIIYDILDKKLIKNKGGIGKYKSNPKLIHFDMRGHRARW